MNISINITIMNGRMIPDTWTNQKKRLAKTEMEFAKKSATAGNWTPVSRVTGGYTHHYTTTATIGATVNTRGRDADFPVAEGHFTTPEVCLNVAYDGFAFRQMPQRNSYTPQVPHASTAASVATADSLANAFEGGGQHIYGMQNVSQDILMSKASLSKAPAPCPTLRARLSKKSQEAISDQISR